MVVLTTGEESGEAMPNQDPPNHGQQDNAQDAPKPSSEQAPSANLQQENSSSVETGIGEQSGDGNTNYMAQSQVFEEYQQKIGQQNIHYHIGSMNGTPWLGMKGFPGFGFPPRTRRGSGTPRDQPEARPDTHEKIDTWFSELSEHQQSMVRATAIFHGAPARDITIAQQDLYRYTHHSSENDMRLDEQERAGDMLNATYTKVEEVEGVQRIFWKDDDENGYSIFGLKVLRLIAGEIQGTAGIVGHDIVPLLETWTANTSDGEHAFRAARALGVIWWCNDQNRLRSTLGTWATDPNPQRQFAAACMIYGAYEIEHTQENIPHLLGEQISPRTPIMEGLLRQWSTESLKPNASAALANVVIAAYGLIGLVWPEVGLDGLDRLLGLTPRDTSVAVQSVPAVALIPAALAYAEVAWFGHTRNVIARLAMHTDRLIRIRKRGHLDAASRYAQEWRAFALNNVFFIFFFPIIASSREDTSKDPHESERAQSTMEAPPHYGSELTLPANLPIPYAETLDTMLAGILAEEETVFRSDIVTLLASALYRQNLRQVSETLQVWGETILRQRYTDMAEVAHLRMRYLDFLETLGKKTQELDGELEMTGSQSGYQKLVRLLRQWPRTSAATVFAESALARLEQQVTVQPAYRREMNNL